MISIIIPVFNVETYLDECLESVRKQSYGNIEIILVNDGSTDTSGDICRKWVEKDSRFLLIEKENGGLSSARNTGLEVASGEYIAFLDSDDVLHMDFCLKMITALSNRPSCDIVACGVTKFVDPDLTNNYPFFKYNDTTVDVKEFWRLILTHKSDNAVCGKLFKRKAFAKSMFRHGLLNEDLVFFKDLSPHIQNIRYISDSLYYYRVREGSITNRINPRISDFYRNALEVKNTIGACPDWRLGQEADGFVLTEITNVLATIEKYNARTTQEPLYREMMVSVTNNPIKSFRNKYWSVPKKLKFILVWKFPSLYRFLLKFK